MKGFFDSRRRYYDLKVHEGFGLAILPCWPLRAGVTLQAREDVLGMMPIHVAAEAGHLEVVEVSSSSSGDPCLYITCVQASMRPCMARAGCSAVAYKHTPFALEKHRGTNLGLLGRMIRRHARKGQHVNLGMCGCDLLTRSSSLQSVWTRTRATCSA